MDILVLSAPLDMTTLYKLQQLFFGLHYDKTADPKFWTYRPLSEQMVRAAADDVCFLPYIYHKMMGKSSPRSLWHLAVRGALYCQCFCISTNGYADWPPLPPIPDDLIVEGNAPEEEILSVLDVPPGKMGIVIGRRGASILAIKEYYNPEILIGGSKGPHDKISFPFFLWLHYPVCFMESFLSPKFRVPNN